MTAAEPKEDSEMICPQCLEDYQFVGFDVDPQTLEHRGIFKCECLEVIVFPEALTRDIIVDEDLKKRIQISRLFHLRASIGQEEQKTAPAVSGLKLHNQHLTRYLEHISQQTFRSFK